MNISIDRNSTKALSRQIADQIREQIRDGVLKVEDQLPPTRVLSKKLSVNRLTVSEAYKRLIHEGLLRSGVGSGTFIARSTEEKTVKLDQSNYTPRFSRELYSFLQTPQTQPLFTEVEPDTVNFASLVPDERFFPVQSFQECINEAIDKEGGKLLQYCGPLGYYPLREYIAQRLAEQGVDSTPDQIVMVNGAQQGIDLVFRCFLSPGDKIAISIPTYHNIFPMLGLLGAGVAPVPMTDRGPDLRSLEEAVRDPSVRLIYTMPNFQNPTGITCDTEHRKRIHEIAVRANLPILEDDFEKDLAFRHENPLPIKALDKEGRVIYLSTFSKSLFPGLRLGWLVAPNETHQALCALKKATDLENSALLQAAAFEFCRRGHYRDHLEKIRNLIRERMEAAFAALEKHMPAGVGWSRPVGGYALWVRLPEGISSQRVFERGRREGVLVSPGNLFSTQGDDPGGVRLSLTLTDVGEIRKGIAILGRAIAGEMKTSSRGRPRAQEPRQHL